MKTFEKDNDCKGIYSAPRKEFIYTCACIIWNKVFTSYALCYV